VVEANGTTPPNLPLRWLFLGLGIAIAASIWWTARMIRHFRKVPG
jgi:hypothetical protein